MKIADQNALTAEQSDKVVRHFVPAEDPVFVDNLGAWYAGGGYYRLWHHKKGMKIISYSDSHDRNAPQFLVKAWKAGDDVTNDEAVAPIAQHAKSYREIVLSKAVLHKTRYRGEGRDTYHSSHQFYQAEYEGKEVHHISKSGFVGNHHKVRIWHPHITLWPVKDKNAENQVESITRKDAELIICRDFVDSLKRALTSHFAIDPDLRHTHPAHFYFGHAKHIFNHAKKKTVPSLEKIDTSMDIKGNAAELIRLLANNPLTHPVSFLWHLVAMAIEARAVSRKESKESMPGCLYPSDPLVKDLSSASPYAYPLGGFLRPLKDEVLAEATCIHQPVFGKPNLFRHIHRIARFEDDGMNGLSEAYLGPTIGSTLRFYWHQHQHHNQEQRRSVTEGVGAIKIFRPDGLTITIFEKQTQAWISFEPERKFESGNFLPAAIMEKLETDSIIALTRTAHGAKISSLSFGEADLIFRKKFGDAFRTPHRPDPAPPLQPPNASSSP